MVTLGGTQLRLFLIGVGALIRGRLTNTGYSTLTGSRSTDNKSNLLTVRASSVCVSAKKGGSLLAVIRAPSSLRAAFSTYHTLGIRHLDNVHRLKNRLVSSVLTVTQRGTLSALSILNVIYQKGHTSAHAQTAPSVMIGTKTPILHTGRVSSIFLTLIKLSSATAAAPLHAKYKTSKSGLTRHVCHLAYHTTVNVESGVTHSQLVALAHMFSDKVRITLYGNSGKMTLIVLRISIGMQVMLAGRVTLRRRHLILNLRRSVIGTHRRLRRRQSLLTLILRHRMLARANTRIFHLTRMSSVTLNIFPGMTTKLHKGTQGLLNGH